MKTKFFRLFNSKGAALAMCGILSMFGLAGSANAECVVDKTGGDPDPSNFTLLIDASSSCANLSDNMYGCDIDNTGSCIIYGPEDKEIEVELVEGSVGGTTPIRWSSEGDGQVVFVVQVGANNGGSCGTSYTPGSNFGKGLGFLKNNGQIQKMNQISFCSDFLEPAPLPSPDAEICPPNYQLAVNNLSTVTGLDFAFLGDPNDASRRSLCVPNGADGAPDTVRIACVDQCVTKPECLLDPNAAACSPSVCEPSGSWTTKRTGTDTFECTDLADPTPVTDPPPYCWEIQQDLDGVCNTSNEWEPQEETVLTIKKGHVNPYVWQTCYSSGGRYVCETMCYAFSAADALACPPGSTLF